MRLPPDPALPSDPDSDYSVRLVQSLKTILRSLSQKVNGLADGSVSAIDNAATSVPTVGTWNRGDFVRNSQPTESGTAGSKYVVFGWSCTVSGTPGTWVQCRFLTGN